MDYPRDSKLKPRMLSGPKQARTHLLGQARRLMDALKKVDKSGTGKVSRKIFAKALTEEGGLGKVGEMELTR